LPSPCQDLLLAVAAAVATAYVTAVEVAVAVTDAAGVIEIIWNLLSADLVL